MQTGARPGGADPTAQSIRSHSQASHLEAMPVCAVPELGSWGVIRHVSLKSTEPLLECEHLSTADAHYFDVRRRLTSALPRSLARPEPSAAVLPCYASRSTQGPTRPAAPLHQMLRRHACCQIGHCYDSHAQASTT